MKCHVILCLIHRLTRPPKRGGGGGGGWGGEVAAAVTVEYEI